ncbi:MAG: PqqD family peptide modification chaperone [candidate division KSB1 bacterium]|nr:PqqD family peptide modification chaperone [candidate division KSB1 bacterium]MDZ7276123.1 PqqD family peptide modification chaperone [candidate division KSB1 bacterium]MDZ7287097.1 PqqD family peptide modification chaperone [candidate division KSB1 bacterium]MDZ7296978.1 PqqD family peptide modification chaperone [candidate division KSB1 bacterium]MDZ7306193.1 PqqD family peptide modification chaperone [candidate division KSB1 bacterium]
MERTLTGTTRVVAAPEQIFSDLGGEIVILNLNTGVYHGLDEVGARIWHLLQQPITVDELHAAILAEYEVEAEICRRDILELLRTLLDAGLIHFADASLA